MSAARRLTLRTLLAGLLAAIGLTVLPAAPAAAIQTISWIQAPPSTANVGDTVAFRWTGRADTFLGARITGCFANYPDGGNYSISFGGNFTTGTCQTSKIITRSGTYPITVGFYLTTGGTMTMAWNVNVSAPTPTVITSGNVTTTASSLAGAPATFSAYGTDGTYGTYAASCTPQSGSTFPPGTTLVQCQATNGAGRTGYASLSVTVQKATPVIAWSPPATVLAGSRYGDLMTASLSFPTDAVGTFEYRDHNGSHLRPSDLVPAGEGQAISVTWQPATSQEFAAFTPATAWRSVTATSLPATVQIAGPARKTYGDEPFTVTATGTVGGGQVSLALQSGSGCSATYATTPTTVVATVTITSANPCVFVGDQTAKAPYLAAQTAYHSVTVDRRPSSFALAASPITYGQPLSAAIGVTDQSAPGTFDYLVDGAPASPHALMPAGAHTVAVTLTPTDGNVLPVTRTVVATVAQAPQTVTVAPVPDKQYGDPSFRLITDGSGPGALSVTSAGACTNTGPDVTIVRAGDCVLRVQRVGTADYAASPVVEVPVTVRKGTVSITFPTPAPITYGTALAAEQLAATTTPSNAAGNLAYSVGGAPAEGTVLDAGDHSLRVTFEPWDGDNWESTSVTVPIHVEKATPAFTLPTPAAITYGTALGDDQLAATSDQPGRTTYTLDGDGARGAVPDAGTHSLVATFEPDSANYVSVTRETTLVVLKAAQEIDFVLDGPLALGDSVELAASGGGSTEPLTYAATGRACSLEGATLTIVHAGDCSVTASQAGDRNHHAAADVTRSATVAKVVPTLDWDAPDAITYGAALGDAELDASVSPDGATGSIDYFLADGTTPAVGVVLHAGDAQELVAVFTPDETAGEDYESATTRVTIDVAQAAQEITFEELGSATYGDGPVALSATGGDSGEPVTFSVTGPCTVDGDRLRIDGAGECAVTADQAGDRDHAAAPSVSRTLVVAKATQQLAMAPIGEARYGDDPVAVDVTPGASGAPVVLVTDGPCRIEGTSAVLTDAGTCTVTAHQQGTADYLPAEPVSRSFEIVRAILTVTALDATTTYGAPLPGLGYRLSGLRNGDTESVLTEQPTCTTPDGSGTHAGTATITCAGAEALRYEIEYAAGTLTVEKAPLTVLGPVLSKVVGAANPALRPTYAGFVAGDGPSALTTGASCSTPATTASPVGTYAVTCSGATARDYEVTAQPGSLLVTYASAGFAAPLGDGTTAKKGSTVPVKLTLTDASGATIPDGVLRGIAADCRAKVLVDGVEQGCATVAGKQLHFTLSTGSLSVGSHVLSVVVRASDGTVVAQPQATLQVR